MKRLTAVRTLSLGIILGMGLVWMSGAAGAVSFSLEGWEAYAQRAEIRPVMEKNEAAGCLLQKSNGEFRVDSAWRKRFPVQAGTWYHVRAEFVPKGVELPRRSILVKVDWQNKENGRVSQPEYPATRMYAENQTSVIEGVFEAPEEAVSAMVELMYRWDTAGEVRWTAVAFAAQNAPAPRKVKLATVNFRPRNSSGPRENLERFGEYVREAGEHGADLVCLPEGITVVGTGKNYIDVAEPVPGPSTEYLGTLAKAHSLYIVAGIYERDGETVYNTAVLIGRDGQLVGKYHKVALPREEIEGGITPGDDFPVFETDFGRVGMMICWDVQFPEPARRLGENGAEVIAMPIWGGIEPLFAARAIENQVYLLSSSYDACTGIWDREGKIAAEAPENGSIAYCEADLEQTTFWPWLGHLRSRISREAPPSRETTPPCATP